MKRFTVLAGWGILCFSILCSAHAQVFDLAADWSDVNNPNGPWALYKAPGVLFTINQPDWFSNGSNQPAWADEPFPNFTHVPMWAKAVGDVGTLSGQPYSGFVDTGTVYMHTAESGRTGTEFSSVVWTTPADGFVHIDGGVWVAKTFDRPQNWELKLNGTTITGGGLSIGDPYDKSNPFLFSTGSGGSAAIDFPVSQDDEIELLMYRVGPVPGTLIGVDLRIEFRVPEPGTCCLASVAALGLLAPRRWRRSAAELPA